MQVRVNEVRVDTERSIELFDLCDLLGLYDAIGMGGSDQRRPNDRLLVRPGFFELAPQERQVGRDGKEPCKVGC